MSNESLGGKLAGQPTAVSWGPERLEVLAIGADATVQHWWWDGANWNGPQSLPGGNLPSLPAEGLSAVSWGPNRLDVFAAGANGNTPWWWWSDDGLNFAGAEPLPVGANLPA